MGDAGMTVGGRGNDGEEGDLPVAPTGEAAGERGGAGA